ncbi:MAG: ATP-binding protein [Actinomycetota bacterium]
MEIVKAKEIRMEHLNVLIYGDSGVGKTTIIATAPGPVLVLDMEGGSLPLAGKDVDLVKVESPDAIREVLARLKNGELEYKTVALDSITEMYKVIMDEVIKTNPQVSRAYTDQASQSDYGRATELMRRAIRAFRDLPVNVIFTALAQDQKDEVDGTITRLPSLPGKLAYELAGYVDIVGYMFTKIDKDNGGEIKRGVLVQPQGKVIAKDRTSKLGQAVIPDIGKWISAVGGNGKKKGGNK